MRYIFTMSFAGSLLLLLYCITNNKIVKLFSYKLQDILLKGVLFYYLVPLVFLEPLYREVIYRLHIPSRLVSAGVYENIYYYGDVDGEIRFNESYKLQIGIFLVWFLIALVILLVRIYKYLKRKKGLLSTASQITEGVVFELLEKVRMEQNIKRKIRLYDMQTPAFTMGVLQPIICFDSSMSIGELEMTFRHECGHIRRWDVFTRQCVSLAVNIHWFNPLIYLLPQKAERIFGVRIKSESAKGTYGKVKFVGHRVLLVFVKTAQKRYRAFDKALVRSDADSIGEYLTFLCELL